MGSVEQVSALPGGGAFAEIWEQVDGDPGAVADAAAALTKVADGVRSAQRGLGAAATGVGDGWRGSAAEAFDRYLAKLGSASANLEQMMHKAAAELTQAAAAIEDAKDAVRRAADRVLDEVRKAELFAHHDPEIQLVPMIESAVARGCAEARPIASALSSRLADVASAVRTATNVGAYGSVREPGTYLPPAGGHIDWSAVPRPGDTGETRPAGAAGGSGGGGAGASGGGSHSAGPPLGRPTGSVKTWIDEAVKILEQHGYRADQLDPAAINTIIQHESSGNPHAQNNWDSNAAAGQPSKGLMQTIDSTFNAHALPGHDDIWNPVDNIIAGVRYAISRYGSIDNVPGIRAVHAGGSYVGY